MPRKKALINLNKKNEKKSTKIFYYGSRINDVMCIPLQKCTAYGSARCLGRTSFRNQCTTAEIFDRKNKVRLRKLTMHPSTERITAMWAINNLVGGADSEVIGQLRLLQIFPTVFALKPNHLRRTLDLFLLCSERRPSGRALLLPLLGFNRTGDGKF